MTSGTSEERRVGISSEERWHLVLTKKERNEDWYWIGTTDWECWEIDEWVGSNIAMNW